VVGLSGSGTLTSGLTQPGAITALAHRLDDTRDGDVVDTCPLATHVAADLGARIARHGGAALIIDYGDWRTLGDTFQAVQGHSPTDPFAAPGEADLTAHVDFEALARAAAPVRATRLTPQGVFLERLGATQRAEALAARLSGESLSAHIAAHRRLTHPDEMGTLFKVMGLYREGAAPPPGLNP
jgi:SAM-dependent MidA family methyltransferase